MPQNKFMDKVLKTIIKYKMIDSGDKIIVGVSGGPDSICLLHVLNELKSRLNIDLAVVHINHCIRGKTADEDESFVVDFAGLLGVPAYSEKIKVKQVAKNDKLSLEEAGRIVRYNCFEKHMDKIGGQKIAVGHNMNDNAETFLLNLVRGAGMEGLKGIEPVRGSIIRPLIEISRDEIEYYCMENGLKPRFDETNNDSVFTRNRVRNGLIPYIKKNFNPNIIQSLNKTIGIIYDENKFITAITEQQYKECLLKSAPDSIEINLEKLNNFHDAAKKRILRLAVQKLDTNTKAIEKIHIEQMKDLAHKAKTGKVYRFKGGIQAKIQYGVLIFIKEKSKKKKDFCYDISIPCEIEIAETNACLIVRTLEINQIGNVKKGRNICMIDREKIEKSLKIRNRRNGDRIKPEGMSGTKKLKDFFIDEKIPRDERDLIPVIACEEEIIWIIGKRISERYKVTDQTKEVVVFEYLLH